MLHLLKKMMNLGLRSRSLGSSCISAGAGRVRRFLLLSLLPPAPSSAVPRCPGPTPAISRHPHLPALSALSAPLSCVVVAVPGEKLRPGGGRGEPAEVSPDDPGPAPGSVSGPSAGCGSLGRRVLEKGAPGPIPRPQPARGEDSGRANDQQRVRRRAGRAAACVPGPEGRPGPRGFHALTHPRLRALSPPEPFIGCLRSDLRSVNPFWRHLSLTECESPGCAERLSELSGRAGSALLGADGDCPLDGFAGGAAGSTPFCPAGP
uniref:Uncharacterized protein LOC112827627 n=1 Tax=Callorhinus ursinus TaxID=34884 RepID=A0A3Q7PDZ7_CALUR|nr:uncharacterized protein LOC112827627 [Callorhinus ursinus]